MSNITLKVDDDVIRKVRRLAVDKNTTLTQMVRDYLTMVAERDTNQNIHLLQELEESFCQLSRNMGKRDWNREDIYER